MLIVAFKNITAEGWWGVGVSLATDWVPGLPGVRGRTHIDEQSTGLPLADRTSPRFHMAHRLIIARRAARRKIHSGCKCNFLRRVSFFLDMARRGERIAALAEGCRSRRASRCLPMDFEFAPAPKKDQHSADLRSMFELRANTRLIKVARGIAGLRGFIQHLSTASSVARPVGDLLLGMHANDEGELKIPLFAGQGGDWAKFEALETSLSDPKKVSAIPDATIGFTAGDPITHALHLKGCNIGLAPKFLVKLKEALGGNVNVTAPKFFHGTTPEPQGVFEYLGYYFALRRPDLFIDPTTKKPDRAKALSEFDTAQFPLIDNSIVPTADWAKIIPANPNAEIRKHVTSKLGTSFGKRTTVKTPWQYRVTPIDFGPWTVAFPDAASVPRNLSDQLLELEIHLKTDKHFPDYPPVPSMGEGGLREPDLPRLGLHMALRSERRVARLQRTALHVYRGRGGERSGDQAAERHFYRRQCALQFLPETQLRLERDNQRD